MSRGEINVSTQYDHLWALVLAAGEGSRLKTLTTGDDGIPVPKQYCSLDGGPSLLENALRRAERVTRDDRVCTIVATQHRRWWTKSLECYTPDHIVVQPKNCGTAIGIMLPLLRILRQDPQAHIVLLPSDHHVRDERALMNAVLAAEERLQRVPGKAVILGITPDEPDCELGYIVPGDRQEPRAFNVARFVEKPSPHRARELLAQGALWNTFILAARGTTLLKLFAQRCPGILEEMRAIVDGELDESLAEVLLEDFYDTLPSLDFSRDILQGAEEILEVMSVPPCGWSDLGTPKRVHEALKRTPRPGFSLIPNSVSVVLAARAGFGGDTSMARLQEG